MNPIVPRNLNRFVKNVRSIYTSRPKQQDIKMLDIKDEEKVKITFIKANSKRYEVIGKEGWTLMQAVRQNGLDTEFNEFGFCAGQRWCTSCHVFFDPQDFLQLPPASSDEEHYVNFLMDVIPGQSRLGCQVVITKNMDGITLQLPKRYGRGWEEQ